MTKGLRCPNCDTTVNKKVVLDWLLNKKTQFLRCKNTFCNTRWSRNVLEKHKAEFLGDKPKAKPKAKPVVETVKAATKSKPFKAKKPVMRKDQTWLDRIRVVARQYAEHNGEVSIDDLRSWADKHYMQPTSSSAWGSVFQASVWKKVSQKNSTYAKSRSRKITVWALRSPSLVTV